MQRLTHFTQDKKDVIKKVIARLLDASFIKEVYHLDWLANPILVHKRNKEWRMCADYTNLNKHVKRSLWVTPDRSSRGLLGRMQPSKFSRLLLGVSPDPPQGRRSDEDIFHYSVWGILLYNYANRT
jgi:hypothetical protein